MVAVPIIVRIYRGACGHCDQRFEWTLTGDDDGLRAIPPATITIGHLCTRPAQDVALVYHSERDS